MHDLTVSYWLDIMQENVKPKHGAELWLILYCFNYSSNCLAKIFSSGTLTLEATTKVESFFFNRPKYPCYRNLH